MIQHIKSFFITFFMFMIIDLLWLGYLGRPIYKKYLDPLLREDPIWPAAFIFYILFIVGLMFFVLLPALKKNCSKTAWLHGSLYGFFTYMTYELTNYCVIKDWPFMIVPIDIIW